MAKGWDSVHLDEIEPIAVVGGTLCGGRYDERSTSERSGSTRTWHPMRATTSTRSTRRARSGSPLGQPDDAVEHLRRALELRPELVEHVRTDDAFVSLRERSDWPL